jgi:hypothetical protein
MATLNETRCPKCFSKLIDPTTNLPTWTDGPINTLTGAKKEFDETTGLLKPVTNIDKRLYKGLFKIKSVVIAELQEDRLALEIEVGVPEANRTVFSPAEDAANGYWVPNIKHIKELRESTEKILAATDLTKEDYLNYDEDFVERQTPHQLDWIDPVLDGWVGQIKDVHVEDLRKPNLQTNSIWGCYYSAYAGSISTIKSNIYEIRQQTDSITGIKYFEATGRETPHPGGSHAFWLVIFHSPDHWYITELLNILEKTMALFNYRPMI